MHIMEEDGQVQQDENTIEKRESSASPVQRSIDSLVKEDQQQDKEDEEASA